MKLDTMTSASAGAACRKWSALSVRTLTAGVLVFALALGCGQLSRPAAFEAAPQSPGRSGKLVDIGDRSLFLDCAGEGAPTVVLEAGGGTS